MSGIVAVNQIRLALMSWRHSLPAKCQFCGCIPRVFKMWTHNDNTKRSRDETRVICTNEACGAMGPARANIRDALVAWGEL